MKKTKVCTEHSKTSPTCQHLPNTRGHVTYGSRLPRSKSYGANRRAVGSFGNEIERPSPVSWTQAHLPFLFPRVPPPPPPPLVLLGQSNADHGAWQECLLSRRDLQSHKVRCFKNVERLFIHIPFLNHTSSSLLIPSPPSNHLPGVLWQWYTNCVNLPGRFWSVAWD